ncbi:MAG: amidohydrolase family protein, partial [Candidatus Omnitrophica bacterium]|nr:amidohydrolase family protein [Candidatus Omnitrophota bacterium]
LRGREDVRAIKQGLKDGTIDVIASDHAPHTPNEKEIEFDRAEFGVIGLETELAASVSALVHTGIIDWSGLARKMCLNPARILGIDRGTLGVGAIADIVIIAPDQEWTVRKEGLVSLSRNSAFLGKALMGFVELTIYSGKIMYSILP